MKENIKIEPFEPCLVCKTRPEGVIWKSDKKVTSCPFIQYLNKIASSEGSSFLEKNETIAEFRERVKSQDTPMSGCPMINYQPFIKDFF